MYVTLHILISSIQRYILYLLIEHYAKKVYEGWEVVEYSSMRSWTLQHKEESSHIHGPAALLPGYQPPIPFEYVARWVPPDALHKR